MSGLRYWEDFAVGDEVVHGTHEVGEEDIVGFAREFDPQPFHVDAEAAAAGPFGGLIASGWHTAAIYMGLFVRSELLGSASLGSPGVEELRWLVPVRPGDVLTGRSRVVDSWPSETNPTRGTIVGEHELVNQRGEVVMRMRAHAASSRADPRRADSVGACARGCSETAAPRSASSVWARTTSGRGSTTTPPMRSSTRHSTPA